MIKLFESICIIRIFIRRFGKFLDEKSEFGRKLDTRIYRLLGIYIEDIHPYVGDLELKIPCNTKKKNEKLLKTDNEKWDKEKKEKLYRSLLYKEQLIKKLMKNKCTMLHGSYSHYEKKVMNGLNDNAFFEKNDLINDKDYNKLKRKKYKFGLRLLLLLFLLILILPILDLSLGKFKTTGSLLLELCKLSGYGSTNSPQSVPTADVLPALWINTCQAKSYIGFKIFIIFNLLFTYLNNGYYTYTGNFLLL
ncbi:Plasmodium exported protein, unknown function [Plasmodium malariae]|uniref:Uncharacterized protein n=1 Tax=Plasmodium malariae TaxID=5858 RepID=A0A1D3JI89_PLAMA|nr:Plasmodium exported protein, unknown function [Plasmodium malariae]SBT86047.1 Plasmodium exported protein, unknown function [Plasmodium malariae]